MRGDVKGTFAAWIAATSVSAAGPRAGSTRGRMLHFVQFIIFFYLVSRVRVRVREKYIEKIATFFV